MIVTKSDVISANRYLSTTEQQINATYIKDALLAAGWTINAICGMLGNMQAESTINPGIWQNLTVNTSNGFGLVQWTPATKLIEWCSDNGLDYTDIDAQLARINYEAANGVQFYPTDTYPITFAEFIKSTESPEYLAGAFLYNYERPAEYNITPRQTNARTWFTFFGETGDVGTGTEDTTKKRKLPLWLILTALKKVR